MPRGRDRGVEGCWVCSNRCCSNASCPCPGPSISYSSIGQCGKGPAASSACRNSMACLLPLLMWLHTFLLYYKIDPHICCCLLYIYCFFFCATSEWPLYRYRYKDRYRYRYFLCVCICCYLFIIIIILVIFVGSHFCLLVRFNRQFFLFSFSACFLFCFFGSHDKKNKKKNKKKTWSVFRDINELIWTGQFRFDVSTIHLGLCVYLSDGLCTLQIVLIVCACVCVLVKGVV